MTELERSLKCLSLKTGSNLNSEAWVFYKLEAPFDQNDKEFHEVVPVMALPIVGY